MKLAELFTCKEDGVIDPAYVWWALSVTTGLGLEIYCVLSGKPFDLQAFGIGVGALMAGAGLSKKASS